MSTRLPLFPLGAVMVPGLVMPLHIFEHRYRVLVSALTALPDDAPRLFGVIAVQQSWEVGESERPTLHAVGCTAEMRDVTAHDDGRFDVTAVGLERFRLLGIDEDAGTPYLTGEVELLGEPVGEGDADALAGDVVRRFAEYRAALRVGETQLPTEPAVVSYLVAAAAVLPLPKRQELLEEPTTCDRLRAERTLLRSESRIIAEIRSIPAVDLAARPPSPN